MVQIQRSSAVQRPSRNASEALPVFQELLHDLGMADVPTEVTRKFWQLLQVQMG